MTKVLILLVLLASSVWGEIRVAVTYPYIAEVTKAIGGKMVSVETLAKASDDPHFITPKPSLIVKLRDADLLISNGAELEIGWLPPLVEKANNPKIAQAVELSDAIELIKPTQAELDAGGHVHKVGNPHFVLDPHNIIPIARHIALALRLEDPDNKAFYKANEEAFIAQWQTKLKKWDTQMANVKGKKVVQYHKLYDYLLVRYGITSVGEIEVLPGIAPNASHLASLVQTLRKENVSLILQDVYHDIDAAQKIAALSGAKVFVAPHDVGAVDGAVDLEAFYETLIGGIAQ